jgi:uncharacterized protein YndB with AHSA1/START domain
MTQTKSLVFERVMPHPAAKVWKALTRSELIARWLMANDFVLERGAKFTFRATPVAGWSGVTNCEVLELEPEKRLVYTWGDGTESTSGLKTIVTWTLVEEPGGTRVRMEQAGFRAEDEAGFIGMGRGWPTLLERLEQTIE